MKTKKRIRTSLTVIGVLLAAGGLLFGPSLLAGDGRTIQDEAIATPVYSVKTATVEKQTLNAFLDVNGDIISTQQADAYPDTAGKLISVKAALGAFVRKGDLLATLENPEYIALQQSYIESRAQEEYLEAEFQRQETLASSEAVSQKRLQESKAEYLSMKSRREAAAAQLTLLGFDPAIILTGGIIPQLELRAPINGYIANVQINVGSYVAAGSPVCEILDKNKMLLKLTIYEKDIDKIKTGDNLNFRVNGMGTQDFNAVVISLGQMVDNVSRSLEVYATVIGSNAQFRPGMYVSAQISKEMDNQ
jgi:cobalt-zinc-cadmium efflux system membrane fusion protein